MLLQKNWNFNYKWLLAIECVPAATGPIFMSVVKRVFGIARLIDAAPFYRTLLMTLYAKRVCNPELTALKINDVEASRNTLTQLRHASLCADEGLI
jgi:hypothetical protein